MHLSHVNSMVLQTAHYYGRQLLTIRYDATAEGDANQCKGSLNMSHKKTEAFINSS